MVGGDGEISITFAEGARANENDGAVIRALEAGAG
jgi:hypothetical protein